MGPSSRASSTMLWIGVSESMSGAFPTSGRTRGCGMLVSREALIGSAFHRIGRSPDREPRRREVPPDGCLDAIQRFLCAVVSAGCLRAPGVSALARRPPPLLPDLVAFGLPPAAATVGAVAAGC